MKKLWILIVAMFVVAGGIIVACLLIQKGTGSSNSLEVITTDYIDASYSTENATYITATDGEISIDGGGANNSADIITISSKGTYVLSGNFTSSINIDTTRDAIVYLVLDNANITSKTGAAIYASKVETLVIISTEGSENTISDIESYTADYGTEDVDATIYSKGNLAFAGSGTIIIDGYHNHAVHGKDWLQVLSGTLDIASTNDGLVGKDYVAIQGGEVIINSNSDGIKSTEDSDANLGYIAIDGGSITIDATGDAINSISRISITGGEFSLTTGSGASQTSSSSQSAKGLKAENYIIITDGDFTLDTSDDAIHSNSDIAIKAGTFSIKTGDDAIHADNSIAIDDGAIDITQSHEGIESANITINGGTISIDADDDGLNASGGSDDSDANSGPGMNNSSSSDCLLTINGGNIYVNSSGDGLDANGNIVMTGGYIVVDGPTTNGDGAIDYDGTFEISGGTLIASGSSGMLMTPSSSSSQSIISIVFSQSQAANTLFELTDASGNTILSVTPSKTYASIVVSSPDLKSGASYTAIAGGEEITTLTLSNTITSYGSSGGMTGPGGGMRQGGRR